MNTHPDFHGQSTSALTADGWEALARPRSIALVGASGRSSSVSFTTRFLRANADLGYDGAIYLINPNRSEIAGHKCWQSLASLPERPDMVAINLPDEKVLPAVREAIDCGARALMIHSGGFGERGEAGAARERELQRLCREAGIPALGPNCLGIMNVAGKVSISSFKLAQGIVAGSLALISQSGSVASLLMQVAGRHGVSFAASTGNEAVTTTEDLISYAIDDPGTKLIVAFVEALRRPQRLFELADRAHRAGKPIIVLKAGLTEQGGEVSRGHTGALAGSGPVYRQAFEQAGIILVEDFDELSQTVELAMTLRSPFRGKRIGMLGTSGGELGNVTDMCVELGVALPELAPKTLARLQEHLVLPADVTPRNPVDVGTGFNFKGTYEDRMRGAIRAVAADESIDAVLVLQGLHRDSEDLNLSLNREMVMAAAKESESIEKPVVVVSCQSGRSDAEILSVARGAGVPALTGAREALRAIAHLTDHASFDPPASRRAGWAKASIPVSRPRAWPNGFVPQGDLFPFLKEAGLPVTPTIKIGSEAEAETAVARLGEPAVMKIDTFRVEHKSDIGGVALGVRRDTAAARYRELVNCLEPPLGSHAREGIIAAQQVERGIEFYIGAKRDRTFGTVIVCGVGGRSLELLGRTALLLTPFGPDDALQAIRRSGAFPFLDGFRGGPRADFAKLADLVVAVGRLAAALGDRLEVLDLNPVIVNRDHPGGCIADARLALREGE